MKQEIIMAKLKGAAVFGQSGGPTSVINSSAAGVFLTALKSGCITKVYGAANGIRGILDGKLYDIGCEDEKELLYLKNTPSSALGSVRYKLADAAEDETDYKRLLEVFKQFNIRYFFYNGVMTTGWKKISGNWYFFEGNGHMVVNSSRTINGKSYRFDKNGICQNP